MEDFSRIVNWENVFKQSTIFKNNKPFNFAFIEEFFEREFYERLYQSFPTVDQTWESSHVFHKNQLLRFWGDYGEGKVVGNKDDPYFSKEWNKFKRYVHTPEFISNFRENWKSIVFGCGQNAKNQIIHFFYTQRYRHFRKFFDFRSLRQLVGKIPA